MVGDSRVREAPASMLATAPLYILEVAAHQAIPTITKPTVHRRTPGSSVVFVIVRC